jgi:hypothetical protein
MLRSVVTAIEPNVGQIMLGCKDFGPSRQTKHPKEGVTQGYTCQRRAEERHKSLVRLDSVAPSLMNSVHHFELQLEFKWERSRDARVNHYKYQAWDKFKVKFRRRVSTYGAGWTDRVNHGSKDRTPGLGFEAVEPAGTQVLQGGGHPAAGRDVEVVWCWIHQQACSPASWRDNSQQLIVLVWVYTLIHWTRKHTGIYRIDWGGENSF